MQSCTPEILEECARNEELARQNLLSILFAVDSDDETIQAWATEALENCGAPLERDLRAIAKVLESASESVAYWSCTLLGRSGETANSFQEILTKVLEKGSGNASRRAAWALGKIGKLDSPARSALEKAANQPDNPFRAVALESLTHANG